MRLKRILLPMLAIGAFALVAIPLAHAQGNFGLDTAAAGAGLKKAELLVTIGNLIKTVLSYLGVLFLILMLYAGFLYMTAQGDSDKIDKAKGIIKGAIIGIVIIAASYALTSFVLNAVTGSDTSTTQQQGSSGTSGGGGSVPAGGACTTDNDCVGAFVCDNNVCVSPLL